MVYFIGCQGSLSSFKIFQKELNVELNCVVFIFIGWVVEKKDVIKDNLKEF